MPKCAQLSLQFYLHRYIVKTFQLERTEGHNSMPYQARNILQLSAIRNGKNLRQFHGMSNVFEQTHLLHLKIQILDTQLFVYIDCQ